MFILSLLAADACAELKSFEAKYVAEYQGFPVKATAVRQLLKLGDHEYRLISSVESALVSVTETSNFEYRSQKLRPLLYSYHRSGLAKKKKEQLEFDWVKAQLIFNEKRSPLQAGTLDKLSLHQKLSEDISKIIGGQQPITELIYLIADKEKRKAYHFKILSEEVLKTPLGMFRTIPVERLRKKKDRQTQFWFAVDHEYLLVKAVQQNEEGSVELNLVSATVDGVEIDEN